MYCQGRSGFAVRLADPPGPNGTQSTGMLQPLTSGSEPSGLTAVRSHSLDETDADSMQPSRLPPATTLLRRWSYPTSTKTLGNPPNGICCSPQPSRIIESNYAKPGR